LKNICVVWQGSGRAADLLADAYSGFKDTLQDVDCEDVEFSQEFDTVLRDNIRRKLGIRDAMELQRCVDDVTDTIAKRNFLTICEPSAVGSASDITASILDALKKNHGMLTDINP